jgi:hypothetical protein
MTHVKERPILFSTEMVRAILDGRKIQTRRRVDMPKESIDNALWGFTAFTPEGHISFRGIHADGQYGESFVKLKYGQNGDILWVRETFSKVAHSSYRQSNGVLQMPIDEIYSAVFKAGWDRSAPQWQPSIHMPKVAARIWLEITDIRVERLHDITEEDAIAEGCEHAFDIHQRGVTIEKTPTGGVISGAKSYRRGYRLLWERINGEGSWHTDPWVWVISFKVLSTTGKPSS